MTAPFEVEVVNGEIRLRGPAALPLLQRLVLTAKFPDEPNIDVLLSPYVQALVEALFPDTGGRRIDWENPAVGTPPAFLAVAQVVRERYGDDAEALTQALAPYSVPEEQLAPTPGRPSPLDLDRLAEAELRASPAPWSHGDLVDGVGFTVTAADGRPVAIFPDDGLFRAENDARFIALLRNAAAALLDPARKEDWP